MMAMIGGLVSGRASLRPIELIIYDKIDTALQPLEAIGAENRDEGNKTSAETAADSFSRGRESASVEEDLLDRLLALRVDRPRELLRVLTRDRRHDV